MGSKSVLLSFIVLAFCGGMLVQHGARADIYGRVESDGEIQLSNHPTADGYEVWAAAPKDAASDSRAGQDDPSLVQGFAGSGQRYLALVEKAARTNELEPALIHAVITVESRYNPKAVSRKGASGLMQLMPGTAKRYGVSNVFDPAQNVGAGARYLRDLLKMFNNDLQLALAAYNAGENAVIRHRKIPPYQETAAYVPKVLAYYRKFAQRKVDS
jgi:soluble lytic murein transglycosylase-like protein